MKYLIVGMLVFALIVAGCAGQQAPAQQQNAGGEVQQNTPPAGNEQQSPPPPPAPAANNSTQLPQPANNSTQPPPPAPAAEPEVKEFTIVATLWKFTPSTIEVNKGDRVRIVLKSEEGNHGISIPDFGVDVQASLGQTRTAEFTADKAGTFQFRCNLFCGSGHSEMTGTLVVKE